VAKELPDRLASLYRVGQVINSSLVLDEVLGLVIDNLIEVTGAERGAILLLDERGDLVVRAARSLDHMTLTGASFQTSRSILREVATTGLSRLISDASRELPAFESVLMHHLISVLCAPLLVRGAVRGVLYVDHRLTTGAFMEDDQQLLEAFAGQAAVAIENARLYQELAEQERQRRELEIARSMQASLMPSELPAPAGFELAGACVPARHVGGDFFDAFSPTEHETVVFLGDVSGKGVPAALLMGMVRSVLRAEVQRGASLPEVIRLCNRALYRDFVATGTFATLVLGRLNPIEGEFSYVNCGHCEPILWQAEQRSIGYLAGDGLPLGIVEELVTSERAVRLRPGDVLVIYSDGFSEAKAENGDRFGVERLAEVLGPMVDLSAQVILDEIGNAVDRFVLQEPQSDDQTIMVVRAVG